MLFSFSSFPTRARPVSTFYPDTHFSRTIINFNTTATTKTDVNLLQHPASVQFSQISCRVRANLQISDTTITWPEFRIWIYLFQHECTRINGLCLLKFIDQEACAGDCNHIITLIVFSLCSSTAGSDANHDHNFASQTRTLQNEDEHEVEFKCMIEHR